MKTRSRFLVGALALCMLLSVTACSNAKKDAVATVNGTAITRAEFDKQVEATKKQNPTAFTGTNGAKVLSEFKKSLLERLIENELIRQAAVKEGAKVTSTEIDAQVSSIKAGFASDAAFQSALKSSGMSMADLRNSVRDQLLYQYLYNKVAPTETVTDAQITAYYDSHKSEFTTPAQSRLSHILFATADKAKAQAALAKIKAGGDFATIAKESSIDTGSAVKGGDLGWAASSTYVTEFATAADKLKVGQISDLVQTQFGWHIIKKTGQKAATQKTLAEAKSDVKAAILQQERSDAFNTYLAKFRKTAKIKVLDASLESTATAN